MISGSFITVMSVFSCCENVLLPVVAAFEMDWIFKNNAPTTPKAIITDVIKNIICVADVPAPIEFHPYNA